MTPPVMGPLEFANRVGVGGTISFVGNGPGLLGRSLGGVIDASRVVVRFNLARTFGHEPDVGARTTVLVTNGLDPELDSSAASRIDVAALSAMVMLPPIEQVSAELLDLGRYRGALDDVPALVVFPTLAALDRLAAMSGLPLAKWTTGTYGVYMLSLLLRPTRILLAGFDLFGAGPAHYFHHDRERIARRVARGHAPAAEQALWRLMLPALGVPVDCTPDVAAWIGTLAAVTVVEGSARIAPETE